MPTILYKNDHNISPDDVMKVAVEPSQRTLFPPGDDEEGSRSSHHGLWHVL